MKVSIANVLDSDQFGSPESLAKALAILKYMRVNLDIGAQRFIHASFGAAILG